MGIMNSEDYADVIKQICSALKIRSADRTLIRNVTTFCKGLDTLALQRYNSKAARNEAIVQAYVRSITSVDNNNTLDYDAFVKNINRQEDRPLAQEFEPLTNWIGTHMPVVASKSMGVLVDSRSRKVTNLSHAVTDFEFTVAPRYTQVNEGDGNIVVNEIPTHITYFKISRIMLPYASALRQRNCANEITLTFTGIRNNGIIAREDTYHFLFSYDNTKNPGSNMVELTPINPYCKFCPPLQVVEDLSLRFNDPIYPIAFPPDQLKPVLLNYNANDGRMVFDVPHGLSTGDIIAVKGLRTFDDTANSDLLRVINDPRGLVITEVDTYIIATSVNFSRLVSPDNSFLPVVQVLSRTFRFPLEIGYQGVFDEKA